MIWIRSLEDFYIALFALIIVLFGQNEKWWKWIAEKAISLRIHLRKKEVRHKVLDVICTFLAEAAVLVAVFSVLDTLLGYPKKATPAEVAEFYRHLWSVSSWGGSITMLLLLAALAVAIIQNKGEGG